jgi:hypothetical protein
MVFSGSSPITTTSPSSKAHQKSGCFPPPALPGFNGHMTLSDSRHDRRLLRRWGRYPRHQRVSPDYPNHHSGVPCPLPRRIAWARVDCFPTRAVGIRIVTFEACLGFTRVTAHRIAHPPKAAFVTRLQPSQLPGQAARQLPDQSTILWVESSSTGASRLRGARPQPDIFTGEVMAGHGRLWPDLIINAPWVPTAAEEGGCALEQEPSGGRLRVLVAGVPLQRICSRAGQAPHNTRWSVVKLDLTVDCLLHHRVDDRGAEATPSAMTRAALCSQSSS